MSKTTLLFASLVVLAVPTPGRACGVTAEELKTMRDNHAVAVANKCENAIVRPGLSIGAIYVGQSAEEAVRASAEGIAFEIEGGKVVRVRHTAPSACIATGMFRPLRVVTTTSALAPLDGVTIARDRAGVHVTIQRT